MKCSHGLRRLGSAAVDLAYVACGRFESYFEYNLNAWDVAAGCLIVKEAGGKVTDFKGENDFVFGRRVVASNQLTHEALLTIIQANFKKYCSYDVKQQVLLLLVNLQILISKRLVLP